MEEVCERENCKQALQRVQANKGSAGVDGMTVQQLPEYLKQHWPAIREQLLSGTYKPQPVKRAEIPKPDGGVRKLGIPTVSANCTRAQFAFGMGGDPPSVPSASRPALPGFESAPNRRY
jgi:retron-type reverse transcriptase